MCFQLVFILMQNISKGKLGGNSLNAALRCCWRKGTCATQIMEQQLIRGGKTSLLLELMAWAGSPQTNTETCTRARSLSHTHTVNICQISVSVSTVLHSSELISEPSRSFPQGLLKECRPEFPRNWFSPLMILRTEWCHALVHGVLGTEALTPAECTTASPSVCISVKCECACVCVCALAWSAKVKNGSEPMFFNEASEECGGWTGCVNKRATWSSPWMKHLHYPYKGSEMTGRMHTLPP